MFGTYLLQEVYLDPGKTGPGIKTFEQEMTRRVAGQEHAVTEIVKLYQTYLTGLTMPGRPIANLLFLGPTGTGKTRTVEAAAEILFGNANAVIKIDCAEFQHSHEISKLIGSPPGYIGHRETPPLLTQETLDQYHNEKAQFTLVLFDEIEKASDALWRLLLGILDKGTLTLGDNRRVDFSRTVVFMTSHLGAAEISKFLSGGLGFAARAHAGHRDDSTEEKIKRVALEAAKRRFSPEFMNRLDSIVVFRTLAREDLDEILNIELRIIQDRVFASNAGCRFFFNCTAAARNFLLNAGTDSQYGARHLKRAIERHLVFPLTNLIASGQILEGDTVRVDCPSGNSRLTFSKLLKMPSAVEVGEFTMQAAAAAN